MTGERVPDDLVLTRVEMRNVVERAARGLPWFDGLTAGELRQIATELNLDRAALDQALTEVISQSSARRPINRFLSRYGSLLALAAAGAGAGWLDAWLMRFSIQGHLPIVIALLGVTLANLWSRRRKAQLSRYVIETFVTWLLYGVAWCLTSGQVAENLVLWSVLSPSAATVLGWALMRGPLSRGAKESTISRTPETGRPIRPSGSADEWMRHRVPRGPE
jgi:hypothetical protein